MYLFCIIGRLNVGVCMYIRGQCRFGTGNVCRLHSGFKDPKSYRKAHRTRNLNFWAGGFDILPLIQMCVYVRSSKFEGCGHGGPTGPSSESWGKPTCRQIQDNEMLPLGSVHQRSCYKTVYDQVLPGLCIDCRKTHTPKRGITHMDKHTRSATL